MKKLLKPFLTEAAAVIRDCAKAFESTPLDPHRFAENPPDGWRRATPTAPVPERKAKMQEVNFYVYTLAEIEAMTEAEYRAKVACDGMETREKAIKMLTKKQGKKAGNGNAIEL